jgi:ATP-dependent RNA helicase RhlE
LSDITFKDLELIDSIQRALETEKYTKPTPIQAQSIPHVLAGRDLLGVAQTGTGKTAAFALPILQHLDKARKPAVPRAPRVLVLSPTRELASQISASFQSYGRNIQFRQTIIYGGVGQMPQVRAMQRGVHVVVATPGRLLDLMAQGHVRLDELEIFVLDETDRMMDMGFMPDLKRIISHLPVKRQSLFFSATMPPKIAELANGLLTDPVEVTVTPPSSTVDRIEQHVLFVSQNNKRELLQHVLDSKGVRRCLVFTRTKHGADKVVKQLMQSGVSADAIHGNKSQGARERALQRFRAGNLKVLVATDIAARGIDVDGVTHVINFDLPHEPESYVHRIGRTGRAGASGIALSFCDSSERGALQGIERLIRREIRIDADHPFHCFTAESSRPRGGARSNTGKKPFGNKPSYGKKPYGARSNGGNSSGGNTAGAANSSNGARRPAGKPSYSNNGSVGGYNGQRTQLPRVDGNSTDPDMPKQRRRRRKRQPV